MSMKKLMQIVENAEFDQGHRDARTTNFGTHEFSDKGRADTKMRNVGRYADNAMENESETEELTESDASTLESLHTLLTKAGISDTEIKNGVNLTDLGTQKVAARLGVAGSDVAVLLASLVTSLNKEDRRLQDAYESVIQEDDISTSARYSYEGDANGNVTVRDSQSGKQVYLQGSQATQLLARLHDNSGNTQDILGGYQSMMEAAATKAKCTLCEKQILIDSDGKFATHSFNKKPCLGSGKKAPKAKIAESDSYEGEIYGDKGGSFNFDWQIDGKNGFGNASFTGSPDHPVISLVRVTDRDGNEFSPDPAMKSKLLKAAHDYMSEV